MLTLPDVAAQQWAGLPPAALSFRAFGSHLDDLNLDFQQLGPPQLVTALLTRCLEGPAEWRREPAHLWDLTVGQRIMSLLDVFARSIAPTVAVLLTCRNPECAETIELELAVEELGALQREAETGAVLRLTVEGTELRLRRPTGRDQLAWMAQAPGGEEAAERAILRTLLIAPDEADGGASVPDAWLPAVGTAMEELDPLVSFRPTVRCAICGQDGEYLINLVQITLRGLQRRQQDLVVEVHRLALAYHWSEEQIIAIPAWRRASYLSLLERERR